MSTWRHTTTAAGPRSHCAVLSFSRKRGADGERRDMRLSRPVALVRGLRALCLRLQGKARG